MPSRARWAAASAAVTFSLVTLALTGSALALPKEGELAPNARVEDADGNALELKSFKGKPTLIVYEDKDSAALNKSFKEELSKLAKGDKYKSAVGLAAVADVSSYDWWPVKGFVKSAIRDESKKAGTTIYCDWKGSFRDTLKLKKNSSNVVLIGKDGKVLFAGEGALDANERKRLLELLKSQVEGK